MKIIYDIEIYSNVFLLSYKDYDTKEVVVWEISERKNDFKYIKSFFNTFNGSLIGFNTIHYDNPMLLWLLHNGSRIGKTEGISSLLQKLKAWSDYIINNDFWWNDQNLKKYKYQKQWTDIDLFLYWSKMLRLSKKVSLKGLAIQLNYPVVQELPFDPSMSLNSEQIDVLINYNSIHDLGITELLLQSLEHEVRLRAYIQKEYNLKCMSFDAPKIASELLLLEYCKLTKQESYEVRQERFIHEERLDLPPMTFELPEFKQLYLEMSKAFDSYSKEIVLIKNNTSIKLSYGKGGLHSVNKNESYFSTDDNLIITSDVASLYPTLIINYKLLRFQEVLQLYINVKADRIEAKKNKNKAKDSLLKLILNSTSGLIDNQHSWLYYPQGAMKLRLTGQLILTLTIERLVLKDFKVISANTDGIEVIVPKHREQEYYDIVNQVGTEFNLIFEHEIYKKIIYLNVNSYLAETNDKLKQKGLFVEKPELTNSVDFLIIPKALKAYYIDNIPVEQFVNNHKEIYDFCCSMKVDKSFKVVWTTPEGIKSQQQRLNRFYASTKGGYILKVKDGSEHHLLKDSGVMIYNNHTPNEFPKDINYSFYINKIKEIINQLNNYGQLDLFS
jgi:hypothetical protein